MVQMCVCSQFQAHAAVEGSQNAEAPMDIVVNVIDMNDNNPAFDQDTFLGEVPESSPTGTVRYFHLWLDKYVTFNREELAVIFCGSTDIFVVSLAHFNYSLL